MKLCYNLQTCMDAPLERDLDLCRRVGFEAVEINFAKARDYLKTHSMQELEKLVRGSGLHVATINAIFEINFCAQEEWARVEEEFRFACALGQACGSEKVIVLSNERINLKREVTDEEIRSNTIEVLNRLADLGKPAGMCVGLEPVGDMLIPSIRTAWDVVKEIDRPEVGVVIDDFNLYLWDLLSDVDDIRLVAPEKISIVHLNDAEQIPYRMIDQMHRCMPGDGRIDVLSYLQSVQATGYDGYVSVEVLNPGIWAKGPEIVIREAFDKARACLNQIEQYE